jgi:hypothetical protein
LELYILYALSNVQGCGSIYYPNKETAVILHIVVVLGKLLENIYVTINCIVLCFPQLK